MSITCSLETSWPPCTHNFAGAPVKSTRATCAFGFRRPGYTPTRTWLWSAATRAFSMITPTPSSIPPLSPRFCRLPPKPTTGGRKFEHYRAVESLQQYLLVAQDRIHVDLCTRQPDGTWLLREASRLQDTVELPSIACQLLLTDMYEKLDLPASNVRGAGPAPP